MKKLLLFFLLFFAVQVFAFTPYDYIIDGKNLTYIIDIENITVNDNITATYYLGSALYLTDVTASTSSVWAIVDNGSFPYANDWTSIDDYPSACNSGLFVTGLGDTLTCAYPDYNTTQETIDAVNGTALNVSIATFGFGGETLEQIFGDILNYGVLDEITITDEGGCNISWSAGEVYDKANAQIIDTVAGTYNATSDDMYYLRWVGGTSLSVGTTKHNSSVVGVGHFSCQNNDIIELKTEVAYNEREKGISVGLANIFPIVVTSGLIVSEDTDATFTWDVNLSTGTYWHDGHEEHTISSVIGSQYTNMTRYYHNSTGDWVSDSSQQINATHWDNGTGLEATTANKYYKSLFVITENNVQWIYPTAEYDTVAQALDASNPTKPSGLEVMPNSVSLVLKGDASAFPSASSDNWMDARPLVAGTVSEFVLTDHGSLVGLSDDDHTQYLLASGSRGLSGHWSAGSYNITALNFVGDLFGSWNGSSSLNDSMKGYVDGQDVIYNTSLKEWSDAYTVTVNGTMQNYVVGVNSTCSAYAQGYADSLNTTQTTYIDAMDTTYNNSLKAYLDAQDLLFNSTLKAWSDAYTLSVNSSMLAYVDGRDTLFNNSMKSYVDGMDASFNTSVADYASGYADGLNTTQTVYIDGQDTAFNTSIAGYVEGYYTAGTDLDLASGVFSLETTLNSVTDITLDSGNLTFATTTSGDIVLNPTGDVYVTDDTRNVGVVKTYYNQSCIWTNSSGWLILEGTCS